MRGTHIAKALACGADSVAVGKAYLYGLAAGGEPGVRKAMSILREELERAMGLLGVGTVDELKSRGPELICRRGTMPFPTKCLSDATPRATRRKKEVWVPHDVPPFTCDAETSRTTSYR